MLDSFKEKKDQALREEIKDRMHEALKNNTDRIQKIETTLNELVSIGCVNNLVYESL